MNQDRGREDHRLPGRGAGRAVRPEQMRLAGQGYPVRIRRAIAVGALTVGLVVGGMVTASVVVAEASAGTTAVQAVPIG